jgi:hypothetical protein
VSPGTFLNVSSPNKARNGDSVIVAAVPRAASTRASHRIDVTGPALPVVAIATVRDSVGEA